MNIEMHRKSWGAIVKAADATSRAVDVIASTDDIDLDGEVLVQDWDLRRFEKNPVVLYFHNLSGLFGGEPKDTLPIGRAENTRVEEGKLKARLVFVDEKANPLAEMVYQGFKQGSLRAVSVGFKPSRAVVIERDGKSIAMLSGNELLEISVCPVPCNPSTVAAAKAADPRSAMSIETKSETELAKTWASMTTVQKHNLFVDDPKGYAAARAASLKLRNVADGTKGWEQLSRVELHQLATSDRAAFEKLKADWERRGRPERARKGA